MLYLYNYFHQKTKDSSEGGLVRIPKDTSLWPLNWKTIEYKTVERAPFTALPPHSKKTYDLLEAISKRASPETFKGDSISLEQLGTLLQLSYGEWEEKAGGRRPVPSGGARYPIELYILAWNVTGLEAGVYHYNIQRHGLERYVWETFDKENIASLVSYDFVATGSALVIMTGVFPRTTAKYGSRGYRYALLEAGHIGQNMYLLSGYTGIQVRALAGTHDTEIEKLLNVDGTYESLVYAIALG